MKKIIYTLCIAASLISCGGGSDGPGENNNPTVPVLLSPINNFLCSDSDVVFEWDTSADIDGDAVTYSIEIATDEQFNTIVETSSAIASTSKQVALTRATTYYWRVKAFDEFDGRSAYSSVFKFYTEGYGVENHLPNSPSLVAPLLSSAVAGSAVVLKWDASDLNTGDVLSYDVYVGTTNPPTEKKATAILTKNFELTPLIPNTIYYWKVVVKDNYEGASIGQVWDFKTE